VSGDQSGPWSGRTYDRGGVRCVRWEALLWIARLDAEKASAYSIVSVETRA